MASAGNSLYNPVLAVRSSIGLVLREGTNAEGNEIFKEPTKAIAAPEEGGTPKLLLSRVLAFSPDGNFLAYCDSLRTVVIDLSQGMKELWSQDLAKTTFIAFSPLSTLCLTWEPFAITKDKPEPESNVRVWDTKSGALISQFIHKKSAGWAPQFSDDESLCVKLVGSELLFHSNGNLGKYEKKFVVPKIGSFSLSKGGAPHHIACYIPVAKGQPGIVKILSCADFGTVATKTFWKADSCNMIWNPKGTAVIIMAITDVDTTGQSYYGEQNLYLLKVKGEGFLVPLAKNGPVYQVDWNPNSSEFCVVYGYMPAKATLFNLAGEATMDFGTGPRNECHYNPIGNILCICGFGNLRGNMEFWSPKDKKKISQARAEDTTFFQWAPDGYHFVTATTAPRLRVNNGYKIWKYTGQTIAEVKFPENRELWEVKWRPDPGASKDFKIDYGNCVMEMVGAGVTGGASTPGVNKDSVYVPPHMRGGKAKPAQPPGPRPKKPQEETNQVQNEKGPEKTEKQKEIMKLQKKIREIENLKVKRDAGETLQPNQTEKISKEQELRDQLDDLSLSY